VEKWKNSLVLIEIKISRRVAGATPLNASEKSLSLLLRKYTLVNAPLPHAGRNDSDARRGRDKANRRVGENG
jgi:hypothetical protein